MMPWEPTRDIMRRTIANLEFIERHATQNGPYEATQLVNSFLGAVAHPWEKYRSELESMPLSCSEGWPRLPKERPKDTEPASLCDALRLLRNGIAHGNIEFLPGRDGAIQSLRIWNSDRGRRTWGTIISIVELRRFLKEFAALAEHLADQEIRTRTRSA